jgi:hypothetical protein
VDPAPTLGDVQVVAALLKQKHLFKFKVLQKWYDVGNVTSYAAARKVFSPRYHVLFKSDESICFLGNRVIKFFADERRAFRRIERGLLLGNLVPSIDGSSTHFFSMELVQGTLVAESRTYGEVCRVLSWASEFLWVNQLVCQENVELCKEFYLTKSLQRMHMQLERLGGEEINCINGLQTGSAADMLSSVDWEWLCTDTFYQFHGDFILDNIIAVGHGSYKIIDWREDFGGSLTHGDKYYDLAKFRHNIIINHGNLQRSFFTLSVVDDLLFVDCKCNFCQIRQLADFDAFVEKNGLDLKKVKVLMALIWINMAPLHDLDIGSFLFYFGKLNLFLELRP